MKDILKKKKSNFLIYQNSICFITPDAPFAVGVLKNAKYLAFSTLNMKNTQTSDVPKTICF